MRYYCYIKSHCEVSDWERECEAKSKKEACKKFAKMAGYDWTPEMMEEFVESEAQLNKLWHNAQTLRAKKGRML